MTKKDKINEVFIYRKYLQARESGKSIRVLAEELGIARATIYVIIDRVEEGDKIKLNACVSKAIDDCIWEHKYKNKFLAMKSEKKSAKRKIIKSIIKRMFDDGFGIREISRRIEKNPSTVLYHLNDEK